MTPRKILLASAVLAVTSQASLAGGEPRYYQSPYPSEQPPVVVYTTPPNPIVGIVGGVVSLPFTVLGGIATAIAPPAVVSCVAPNGWLYPCAGPTPWPGYGGRGPLPPPPATYLPPDPPRPAYEPRRPPWHSGGDGCYDGQGRFIGDGNRECID
jgi:hypothetical protein